MRSGPFKARAHKVDAEIMLEGFGKCKNMLPLNTSDDPTRCMQLKENTKKWSRYIYRTKPRPVVVQIIFIGDGSADRPISPDFTRPKLSTFLNRKVWPILIKPWITGDFLSSQPQNQKFLFQRLNFAYFSTHHHTT
jgi:hypothetical protein